MIQLLMVLSLTGINDASLAARPIQPCVWPNRCAQEQVASIQPCVWPNRCSQQTLAMTPVQPCVWPNRCSNDA
jgi:hypothetical protein